MQHFICNIATIGLFCLLSGCSSAQVAQTPVTFPHVVGTISPLQLVLVTVIENRPLPTSGVGNTIDVTFKITASNGRLQQITHSFSKDENGTFRSSDG